MHGKRFYRLIKRHHRNMVCVCIIINGLYIMVCVYVGEIKTGDAKKLIIKKVMLKVSKMMKNLMDSCGGEVTN